MNRHQGGKEKEKIEASLSEGIEDVQQNSVLGKYSHAEMIDHVKGLAVDPCNPQFSQDNIWPLWNVILRLRKVRVLEDSEIPWRKRKLEQFAKDNLGAPSPLVMPSQQNITKLSRRQLSHASSASSLLNSANSTECDYESCICVSRTSSSIVTFDGTLSEKEASQEFSFLENGAPWNHTDKDASPLVDSDESVIGSNPPSPGNMTTNKASPAKISKATRLLNSKSMDGPQRRHLQTTRRSMRMPSYIADSDNKKVVPVGPRFQADVPEWSDPVDRNTLIDVYKSDSNNSKWLGSRDWPIDVGKMQKSTKTCERARPSSCCCVRPGSADCFRHHILEEGEILQSDLGPAFFCWKFNEMGGQGSNLWTAKEQKTFDSLVKRGSSSNGKDFMKRALKCFPNKCRKDIIHYYFDVYIPQRMSLQTRSASVEQVDTDEEDEDGAENFNYMGSQKRYKGKTRSKEVNARYLRQAS